MYTIEDVTETSQSDMVRFLLRHENYTLFLLNNHAAYGYQLTYAPYSGNFKLIKSSGNIVGVFCLTRGGKLLIHSEVREPVFTQILQSCRNEPIPLSGLVGDWDFCKVFWDFLKAKKAIVDEVFYAKEILYSVDISTQSSHSSPLPNDPQVRLLTSKDYAQWQPLRLDYLKEEKIPNDLNSRQFHRIYLDKVKKQIAWGAFVDEHLVSIADFNAQILDLGQVGGVYTVPAFRKRGLAKSVMRKLIHDAKTIHQIRKLIIFTGENNAPARKLYESLNAVHIGYFALLFSSPVE